MHVLLRVEHGREDGFRYRLEPGERCLVGRGSEADLQLTSHSVSRRHALFRFEADGLYVSDLGSRNGTAVDDRRLPPHEPHRLEAERVKLGRYDIHVDVVTGEAERTRTATWRAKDTEAVPPGYRLEALLGEGGFSRVWAVRKLDDDSRYAIKILRRGAATEDHERFLREGQVCATLRSPFLVQTYAYGLLKGRPYIVMERVQGVSAARMLFKGALPLRVALQLGQDLARALEVAHSAGVIHRDVKPANVLVTTRQRAKLGDFGIAKIVSDQALTETGVGLGSLPYIPPEQAFEARAADAFSDLYGLGASLYHFLAGEPPFEAPARKEGAPALRRVMRKIREEAPPSLAERAPKCPPDVARLVMRLLAKEPTARGADAHELVLELQELRERLGLESRGKSETQTGLSPVRLSEEDDDEEGVASR